MRNLTPFAGSGLLDEFFRDVNPGYFVKPLHGDGLPSHIKVDVKETANELVVEAEIPGASKENINVTIDDNHLTISAEISQLDSQNKDEKVLRTERYFGLVSRSFKLPSDIDEQSSSARYENGILTLNLAKKVKQTGQRLSIQ
jgi:HSP20 family protein